MLGAARAKTPMGIQIPIFFVHILEHTPNMKESILLLEFAFAKLKLNFKTDFKNLGSGCENFLARVVA